MEATFNLQALWTRLADVNALTLEARSTNSDVGWNGMGRGEVVVEIVESGTMLFHENGGWTSDGGTKLAFTNVYRWTALAESSSLRLEHLRLGNENPVYLFDLKQTGKVTWQSVEPHVCREDLYTAIMTFDGEVLALHWTIKGPAKNESIRYSYR